jgi:heme-degrading monooxygenase HmoA
VLFYWRDEESMAVWRSDPAHVRMQQRGRDEFFSWYQIRITKVERESDWRLGG